MNPFCLVFCTDRVGACIEQISVPGGAHCDAGGKDANKICKIDAVGAVLKTQSFEAYAIDWKDAG